MGRRVGQLAGALAYVLMMIRLGRLFESGPDLPNWRLILLASTFLGAAAWWLLDQVTTRRGLKLGIFIIGGALLALRISVPETLMGGVLPSGDTFGAMGQELGSAYRIIRSGIPPVVPQEGVISILALVLWCVGALYTWGNTGGPYAAMFVPSLVVYFQFAVFDRGEAGLGWMGLSALALALSAISMALERRQETGRARDAEGWPMRRRAVELAVVVSALLGIGAVAVADGASEVVSEYGNAPWRGGSGFGSGPGDGVRFDGLVGLRQRVINRSDVPVFRATLSGDLADTVRPYWRMETLDTYDGEEWSRSSTALNRYVPGSPLANETDVYQGTSHDILQRVRIEALETELAPTAGVPVEIQNATDAPRPRRPTEFQVLPDSAILIPSGLGQEDEYQVRSLFPDRTADLGALATTANGDLSPIFAGAAADGLFPYEPRLVTDIAVEPLDLDRYTELPEDTPVEIGVVARQRTLGATTDFERAWMLEAWFRDPEVFTYTTDVNTGHDALALEEWLTDPASLNFRTGYCEQFAAAMGVLARELGIPSRVVWGFTPGSVTTRSDGTSEIEVRDTNAHAWVELWIEPHGWFQFDPTPRGEFQPASITAGFDPTEYIPENPTASNLQTPTGPGQIGDPELLGEEDSTVPGDNSTGWWLLVPVALALVAGTIPLAKRARRRLRLTRVRHGDITPAWDEIVDRLTDLGEEPAFALTPIEVAEHADPALMPLAMSYSSTVYGGRKGQATESDLIGVESWIERTYTMPRRLKAAFNTRSLFRSR